MSLNSCVCMGSAGPEFILLPCMHAGQFGAVESAVYSPVPGKTIKVAIKKTIDVSSLLR